jgi:hypothetical protein
MPSLACADTDDDDHTAAVVHDVDVRGRINLLSRRAFGFARRGYNLLRGAGLDQLLWALALCLAVGCQGVGGNGASSPADVSIAVSAHAAIQSTNTGALAVYKNGDYQANSWVPGGGNDGRVYYDLNFDRFWTSAIAYVNPGDLQLAVSQNGDPTNHAWWVYHYFYSGPLDQPTLGLGITNTVIAQRWAGQGIFVEDTQALMYASPLNTSVIPMRGSLGYAAHYPAGIGIDRNFVVSTNNASSYFIQRINHDRSEDHAVVSVNHIANYSIRNGPYTLYSPVTPDPQDVLIAWGAHHLYVVNTVASGNYLCQRIVDLYDVGASPFAPQNVGGTTFCLSGADVWEGSLNQTANGDLYMVANCSGPSLPVSLCFAKWNGPQATPQPVFLKKQGTSYLNDRLGDYTGAAPNWNNKVADLN